jgi:hypothetical protein
MKYLLIILVFISCNNSGPGRTNTSPALSSCDSLTRTVDSLKKQLFVANFKVERVRYYLKVVDKNPSQSKFLRGWVKRAVDEEK